MGLRIYDSLRRVNNVLWTRSFWYIFRSLSDEEAGQLVKAIFATWGSTGKKAIPPENPKLLSEYYEIMRELNVAASRYLEKAGRWIEDYESDFDDENEDEI